MHIVSGNQYPADVGALFAFTLEPFSKNLLIAKELRVGSSVRSTIHKH
jgi:hypothetical protein